MKARGWFAGGVLLLIGLVAGSCGGNRNCLVIPAQIDLVTERREAAMTELENRATQVDRMQSSVDRAVNRYEDLLKEKALLDSLLTAGGAD